MPCLFGGLVFWALCSSRHTAISVTSAISLLVGTSIGELSTWRSGQAHRAQHGHRGAGRCVRHCGLGGAGRRRVNFVSETVLIGFKCGIAFVLASTQIRSCLGFPAAKAGSGRGWRTSSLTSARRIPSRSHSASQRWWSSSPERSLLPGKPVALVVVALGIAATSIFDLEARGVHVLGLVPQGLPPFGLPALTLADFDSIAADCDGVLPARSGRVVRDRPDVRAQARLPLRRESRAACARRRQSDVGARSWLPHQRRDVAIAGQRIGRRAHAAIRFDRGADPADDHGRFLRPTARSAAARSRRDRAGRGHRPRQPRSVEEAVALQPSASSRSRRSRSSACSARASSAACWSAWCCRSCCCCDAPLSRTSPSSVACVNRASSRRSPTTSRARACRRCWWPASTAASSISTPNARAIGSLELVTARRESHFASSILFLGTVPTVDLAGADMLIELRHALAARGIELRSPGRTAGFAMRWFAPDWLRRPSMRSGRSLTPCLNPEWRRVHCRQSSWNARNLTSGFVRCA